MCKGCAPLLKAINAYIQKADNDLEDDLKDAGFIDSKDTMKEISSIEEQVAEELGRFDDILLYSMVGMVGAEGLEEFANEIWPKVKAENKLDKTLHKIFLNEFKTFMPNLVNHYNFQIDPELIVTQITARTTAWIETWSEELASIMKLNTQQQIERILTRGLEEGQSVAEFTQSLLDSGVRDNYYKARRVAVTEMLRAHSYAQEEALLQNPAVEEKEWIHTGAHANEPRQNHVDMNGIIVPKSNPFELTGADGVIYYPMFPRDSSLPPGESINCHCIHRGIVNESVLGLPLEERKRLQAEAIAEDDGAWEAELDAKNQAKAGIE